jgi:hypothetical protein
MFLLSIMPPPREPSPDRMLFAPVFRAGGLFQ